MKQPASEKLLLDLYPPVGELFVSFALLESQVTQIVAIAYALPGAKGIKKKIPHQFGEKTAFLLQAFNTLPELAPFKVDGIAIAVETAPIASLRNHLVHGSLGEVDDTTGVLSFVKVDIDKAGNIYKLNERDVTLIEILNVSGQSTALVRRAIVLQLQMLKDIHGVRF